VRHICRHQEPNRDALVLYAGFIGDAADYVVNRLIETTIGKDREFVTWRSEQPAAAAPTLNGRDQTTAARPCQGRLLEENAMRFFVEYRFVLSLALRAITGVIGRHTWPFPEQNVHLALIQARQPTIYARFSYTYRFVASLALSPLMGVVGLHVRPFRGDNLLLEPIPARLPTRAKDAAGDTN
jgi:hypothetical protein